MSLCFMPKQDTQFFSKNKAFSLRNDVASDEMYTVKDDTTAYLYFNSPWTSGNGATSMQRVHLPYISIK